MVYLFTTALVVLLVPFFLGWILAVGAMISAPFAGFLSSCLLSLKKRYPASPARKFICYESVPRARGKSA